MPTQRQPGIHLHMNSGTRKIGSKFQAYHEYYWILIARNGKTIARSSETYKTKRAAVKSIGIITDFIVDQNPNYYYDHTKDDAIKIIEY